MVTDVLTDTGWAVVGLVLLRNWYFGHGIDVHGWSRHIWDFYCSVVFLESSCSCRPT